jgi:hypothetical protein
MPGEFPSVLSLPQVGLKAMRGGGIWLRFLTVETRASLLATFCALGPLQRGGGSGAFFPHRDPSRSVWVPGWRFGPGCASVWKGRAAGARQLSGQMRT